MQESGLAEQRWKTTTLKSIETDCHFSKLGEDETAGVLQAKALKVIYRGPRRLTELSSYAKRKQDARGVVEGAMS